MTAAVRFARCDSCDSTKPSAPGLPFFMDRGPTGAEATDQCKCGYHRCAHERQPRNVDPRSVIERGECTGFVARGPREMDTYYCGCRGWE